MIVEAPWLPCERCNFMRPDCTCTPIGEEFWRGQLTASRRVRQEKHLAWKREFRRGRAAA